jgi:hypothetical protein
MSKKVRKRRAIIVLGSHRSGTSALAGVLGLLGVKLPVRLMPAARGNLKGHFEPWRIMEIDDQILAAVGTTWSSWSEIPQALLLSKQSHAFVDELIEAIDEDYGAASLFVIKEPRMCRLMPLWHHVLDRIDIVPYFAVPLRNPVEVAKSLQSRDGLPLAHGCLLWLRHVLDAERLTRGYPRVFFHYQDLLAEPNVIINRIGKDLGIKWPRPVESSIGEIEDFLDPNLRTQVAEERDIDDMGGYSPWLRQAYDCYEALVRSPTDRRAKRKLDNLHAAFEASDAAFTPVLAALRETLAAKQHELTAVGRALAERDSQVAERDAKLAERDAKLAERDNQVAERDAKLAERDNQVAERDAKLAERDCELGRLRETLASFDRELAHTRETIQALQSTVSALRMSTSWRITAPLRWLKHLRDRGVQN